MIHRFLPAVGAALVVFTSLVSTRPANAAESGVKITELADRLTIHVNGALFSEYHFKNVSRPFLYPIIGPGGAPMTRNFPMKDVEGEDRDHPHHRALWYAHGDVNGHDFWSESAKAGKTLHEKFLEVSSGAHSGVIRSLNKLVSVDGKLICTDERTVRIHLTDSTPMLDFELTVHASNGDVTFGDTKEGSMGIRVAESMRLKAPKNKPGAGHIVNSEGVRDGQTWGKRAKWCDYYGPVNGKTVGVAIFDHPQNPRHPTWWHVRDYGLFAANPFGIHDFESLPDKTKGNYVIPAGKTATFRYRFYFHEGDEKQGKVAEAYNSYAK